MDINWDQPVLAIVALLFHGSGLLLALDVLLYGRTPQGVIAWVLCLVMFPYLTIPVYLIFGPHRFYEYKLKIGKAWDEFRDQVDRSLGPMRAKRVELEGGLRDDQVFLESLCQWPLTSGNKLEILDIGCEFFETLFSELQQAKRYILMEYYILRHDGMGERLLQVLGERAKAGVEVYLLYDQIGSWGLGNWYRKKLRRAGVKAEVFRTNRDLYHQLRLNFRNHRKITVIDGDTAFVGGHNIGDEYSGRSKRYGDWRDTSLKIRGPMVQSLQMVFAQDWFWVKGSVPTLNWNPDHFEEDAHKALAIPTGPTDAEDSCSLLFLDLISLAQERIWISTPYLVPDDAICSALALASKRGVDVRILLPDISDQVLTALATRSYVRQFVNAGIKVFRYRDGFTHQKTVLVDDEISCIGTVNLDNRSLRLNFEISIVTFSREFNSSVQEMLERDFSRSRQVNRKEARESSLLFRLAVQVARLFSPIL